MKSAKQSMNFYHAATEKFNPSELMKHILFRDDVPIVNRDELITSAEDRSLFCSFLNGVLLWDYTTDFNNTTIYFEDQGDIIFAGVYDELTNSFISRVPFLSARFSGHTSSYTYSKSNFDELKGMLKPVLTVG